MRYPKALSVLPLAAAVVLLACSQESCREDDRSCNELGNKSEWSILQSYEHRLRSVRHDKPILRFENAENSGLAVLAFPRRQGTAGYVVMLANSKVAPKDKTLPAEDFAVSSQALDAARSGADLTPEAEKKIVAMTNLATIP